MANVKATDLIDYTRASTGTYLDSDGTLKTASTNTPRIEYDAAGNLLGLLIEESRTNLVTHSHLDGANPTGWVTFNLGGTRTATTLYGLPSIRFQATGERPLLQLPLTLSASTTYTISCYIENAGGNTEEIMQLNGFAGLTGDSRIYTNDADSKGYISNTFTTGTDASGFLRLGLGVATAATGDVTITAIQIEAGSFPTSYIKTTGSTATRSADVASIDVDQFGYNQSEGTLTVEAKRFGTSSEFPRIAQLTDGTSSERISVSIYGSANTAYANVIDGGVSQASLNEATSTGADTYAKLGLSFSDNDFAFAVDGVVEGTDTSGSVPDNISEMLIGDRVSTDQQLNGHIKSITYTPKRLSNAKLQELTS